MDRGFEERKKKHEEKWALDEDLRFKAVARRNKLLGRWAAAELGLSGEEAEAYARAVVTADLKAPGEQDVIGKLRDDFRAKGLAHSDAEFHRKMDEFAALAREQIQAGV